MSEIIWVYWREITEQRTKSVQNTHINLLNAQKLSGKGRTHSVSIRQLFYIPSNGWKVDRICIWEDWQSERAMEE